MHEKRHEKPHEHDDEASRDAVVAADDTGLVAQQELLHEVEIDDERERSRP